MRIFSLIIGVIMFIMTLFSLAKPQELNRPFEDFYFSTENKVYKVKNGEIIKIDDIPPFVESTSEISRDFVVLKEVIYVFNGTFNPVLSQSAHKKSGWTNYYYPSWSTQNNVTYGGISLLSDGSIIVTSMKTSDKEFEGLIKFDPKKRTTKFAQGDNYIDVNLGLDQTLYGLTDTATLNLFDPQTLAITKSINLPKGLGFRAIAVSKRGEIYAVTYSGELVKFDQKGCMVLFLKTLVNRLSDIDISASGKVVVGSADGKVLITDLSLEKVSVITVGNSTVFVTFPSY